MVAIVEDVHMVDMVDIVEEEAMAAMVIEEGDPMVEVAMAAAMDIVSLEDIVEHTTEDIATTATATATVDHTKNGLR